LDLPSGKHAKNYGNSPFLMGKPTISMAILNSYVPEGNDLDSQRSVNEMWVNNGELSNSLR
jgi:hypothetical protein